MASRESIGRKRVEETLRTVTERTAGVTGGDFFHALLLHLSEALKVSYALISECTDDTRTEVRTLAFWTHDRFVENVTYSLAGTPCEHVIAGDVCYHPVDVQNLFPMDTGLIRLHIAGYLGVPLYDTTGAVLGHLAVMDEKPMPYTPQDVAILNIFATRASAEMLRKRSEMALHQEIAERRRTEEALRKALDEVEVLKNRL
ncbi:MAG: GAF domain-containing protein [candidate division Zixibacteria bacterium]|nr:GAF domain-containing protein [candidate division Zixibacteria bacterium]